jgi:hypothetical protein
LIEIRKSFNSIIYRPFNIRQYRYLQLAKHRIFVLWNGIKMRCSNTILFKVYPRICHEIEANFLVLRVLENLS